MVAKPSEVTPLTHDRVRPPARRGGRAGLGGEPGPGQRRDAGSRADRHPRRRLHLVHRRTGHRHGPSPRSPPSTSPRWRSNSAARTRTSCSPTPRLGQRGRPRAHRRVPALRPGLLGGHPADRRGVHRRRLRRRPGRRARRRSGSGDGMDPASETGPLVSEQHRAKVEAHVQQGISEGAKLVTGGARPSDPALAKGSFYLPTIFDRCDRSMRIVQEETFGPILTVERFTDRSRGDRTRQRHGIRSRGGRSDVRSRRGASVWCGHCGTARCGSTISATTPRRRSGADSASPATAASSDQPGWRNTKRSNTSGTTPHPNPPAGSKG